MPAELALIMINAILRASVSRERAVADENARNDSFGGCLCVHRHPGNVERMCGKVDRLSEHDAGVAKATASAARHLLQRTSADSTLAF